MQSRQRYTTLSPASQPPSGSTLSSEHSPPQSMQVMVEGTGTACDATDPPAVYVDAMRVIAGSARGRPLRTPAGDHVRPTSDRVREAIFNALGSLLQWPGLHVVDLFAGTGALGIEALSRGAASATFVDGDRAARRLVADNLRATGFEDQGRVLAGDALSAAADLGRFDVAFCDPPYRFERWPDLLAALDAELVVIESDREIDLPDDWRLVRSRRYGSTVVQFVAEVRPPRTTPPSATPPADVVPAEQQ